MQSNGSQHISEDSLEIYALGRMHEIEAEELEEHLLACAECQERLRQHDDFIRAFRVAANRKRRPVMTRAAPRRRTSWLAMLWRPLPVAGALAVVAAAIVLLAPRPAEIRGTTTVGLTALRGAGPETAPVVPAFHRLRLELDASGLNLPAYNAELANASGKPLWTGSVPSDGARLRVDTALALRPGDYFVRLYPPGSKDPVREFALQAR